MQMNLDAAKAAKEKQYYAGIAVAGGDHPDDRGAEVVAVFGLTDPEASGGIVRGDGSFTKWERPVIAYSGDMLTVMNGSGESIGGDPNIAGQALADIGKHVADESLWNSMPKAVDIAIEHKIALEAAQNSNRAFGRKPQAPAAEATQNRPVMPGQRVVNQPVFGKKPGPDGAVPPRTRQSTAPSFGKKGLS